jgi:DNA modification methylase
MDIGRRAVGESTVVKDFLDGRVTLHAGDCLEVMAHLSAGSIDSCVCDPPYHLTSIVKRFGQPGSAEAKDRDGLYKRASAGFMNKEWDGGDIAFRVKTWAAVFRLLKPGAHLVAFSSTRTYHRMACAIEDAGFEIRDQLAWMYGSGFPKSHDVSKGIDKAGPPGQAPFAEFAVHYEERRKAVGLTHAAICAAGGWHGKVNHGGSSVNWANGYGMPTTEQWAILQPLLHLDDKWSERVARIQYEREVLGIKHGNKLAVAPGQKNDRGSIELAVTASGSDAARQWEGWGTALKPAWEPIVFARKPLIGTVAANLAEFGTGALNIDGCRIDGEQWGPSGALIGGPSVNDYGDGLNNAGRSGSHTLGRWPANVLHDGSDEVVAAFPEAPGQQRGTTGEERAHRTVHAYGEFKGSRHGSEPRGDTGSAARFFYSAKADADDRIASKHPTVKPVDLMQWLVRLVTPKGGLVLDPFAGTGTTGEAAWREGMRAVLIEREPEYQADIARRMALATEGPDGRRRGIAKAKGVSGEPMPLFGDEP